jgi:Sec7-like guanine-nucleotide exchange factor
MLEVAILTFNENPKKGIAYGLENQLFDD